MKKCCVLILIAALIVTLCGCDSSNYKKALSLYEKGKFTEAKAVFSELGDYENAANIVKECDYSYAISLLESGNYEEAKGIFESLGDHRDSVSYANAAIWGTLYAYIWQTC